MYREVFVSEESFSDAIATLTAVFSSWRSFSSLLPSFSFS